MKLAPAVTGDIGDVRTITLAGVANLADASAVEAHVWRNGVAAVTLTAAVADAGARTITVNLGAADGWLATVATAGQWFIEYEVTFGATVLTWPAGAPDVLPVRTEGD